MAEIKKPKTIARDENCAGIELAAGFKGMVLPSAQREPYLFPQLNNLPVVLAKGQG